MKTELESLIHSEEFNKLMDKIKENENNFFSIVGTTHTEHWHSSFYKWLLSPNGSHGFGTKPLEKFIEFYNTKIETPINIESLHLDDIVLKTEKDKMDIYGENNDAVIVIENKVDAKMSSNSSNADQTVDYYEKIAKKLRNRVSIFVLLTKQSDQEAACKDFKKITYQEFYDNVLKEFVKQGSDDETSNLLMKQYEMNLGSLGINIYGDYINNIYKKYAEVIDNIWAKANTDEKTEEKETYNNTEYKDIFNYIFKSIGKSLPKEKGLASVQELVDNGYLEDGWNMFRLYKTYPCYGQILVEDNKAHIGLFDGFEDDGSERNYKGIKADNTSSAFKKARKQLIEEYNLPDVVNTDAGYGWYIYPRIGEKVIECKYETISDLYKGGLELNIENIRNKYPDMKIIEEDYNRIVNNHIQNEMLR